MNESDGLDAPLIFQGKKSGFLEVFIVEGEGLFIGVWDLGVPTGMGVKVLNRLRTDFCLLK